MKTGFTGQTEFEGIERDGARRIRRYTFKDGILKENVCVREVHPPGTWPIPNFDVDEGDYEDE